jgi:hypothetical protein
MAEILSDYLRAQAAEPFVYGCNDCGSFVVGWFDQITGRNAMARWYGKFHDKESCDAFVENSGGIRDVADNFLALEYGATPAPPAVGNAVLAIVNGVKAMGLRVSLDGKVALRTMRGLVITGRAIIVEEWGLPEWNLRLSGVNGNPEIQRIVRRHLKEAIRKFDDIGGPCLR